MSSAWAKAIRRTKTTNGSSDDRSDGVPTEHSLVVVVDAIAAATTPNTPSSCRGTTRTPE